MNLHVQCPNCKQTNKNDSSNLCPQKCLTLTSSDCGCEYVLAYDEKGEFRIEGHDSNCNSKKDSVKPHRIFITKGSLSNPTEKSIKEELTELRIYKETQEKMLYNAKQENIALMDALMRNKDELEKLKKKLKNIKRISKILQSETSE